MIVKNIMETNVLYVKKDMKVLDVVKILLKNNISGLPVVDDDMKVVGVVTETDLIQHEKEPRLPSYMDILGSIIYIEGVKKFEKEFKEMIAEPVETVMTKQVHVIKDEDEVDKVAKIMVEGGVNRVPVIDCTGKLVGIVSRHDMLKLLI